MDQLTQNFTWYLILGIVIAIFGLALLLFGVFTQNKKASLGKIAMALLGLIVTVSGVYTFMVSVRASERLRLNKQLPNGIYQSIANPSYYVNKDMSDVFYLTEDAEGNYTLTNEAEESKNLRFADGLKDLYNINDLHRDTLEKLEGVTLEQPTAE